MALPRGHLSPSQLTSWELCQIRYRVFNVEGAKAPPDFFLHAKTKTHEALLERDLASKIKSGKNLSDPDINEWYRNQIESEGLRIAREDPNLELPPDKTVEEEVSYFKKIVTATIPWRKTVKPIEVEKPLEGEIGGIPVKARLDLISDHGFYSQIEDLKRQGDSPPPAEKSRQLVTYAALTGLSDVALKAVVENKLPVLKESEGQVTQGELDRVRLQYQGSAFQIENAVAKDVWVPVDHGNKRMAWVCSRKFCGAWASDAVDLLTGRDISCPFGERSQTARIVVGSGPSSTPAGTPPSSSTVGGASSTDSSTKRR